MASDRLLQAAERLCSSPCGRYAPSPTGPQHLGNLRTALLAWLQARLAGGRFILRMDDLDRPRVRAGSARQVLDDLGWLGLDWDEGPDRGGAFQPYCQSRRKPFYHAAFRRLAEFGRLYACGCSRRDIEEASSAPHEAGRLLRYPGTCRPAKRFKGATNPPDGGGYGVAWRYRVENERIEVADQLAGTLQQDLAAAVGDFVVRRRDGLFAYQLATVVDDALMGVTDVVRGVDLFDSTPRQIALANALGFPIPRYWHVPLMTGSGGVRLAKRDGSDSLALQRDRGRQPDEIVGMLAASCGLVEPGLRFSGQELLHNLTLREFRLRLQKGSDPSW